MAGIGSKRSDTRFISLAGLSVICIIIALILLLLVPRGDPRIERARQNIFDIVTPVIDVLAYPFRKIVDARENFSALLNLRTRTSLLEVENRDLKYQLDEFQRMQILLNRYQKLLALPEEPNLQMASARVVADISGLFTHSILVNAGRDAGVMEGQAVLGNKGLVGRVVSVGGSSSRILLLTDFSSKIPVVALASDVRGILTGRNDLRPILDFLPRGAILQTGERLVTSGDGGSIPVGLPVGTVQYDRSGNVQIVLQENFQRLNYVRIVLASELEAPPAVSAGTLRPKSHAKHEQNGSR